MDETTTVQNIFIAVNREIRRQVGEHEERHHGLPPRRTAPITAVPFASWTIDDEQTARAIELLQGEHATLDDVALTLDVPVLVLERAIADYRPPYRRWVRERSQG